MPTEKTLKAWSEKASFLLNEITAEIIDLKPIKSLLQEIAGIAEPPTDKQRLFLSPPKAFHEMGGIFIIAINGDLVDDFRTGVV
jgi:hypothetical protein